MEEDTWYTDRYCNAYSNPKCFGLEIVEFTSEPDMSYQFNYVILWRDTEGVLWFGHDRGCSCPRPFESFQGKELMTPYKGHEQEYKDLVYNTKHP